jgi:hypothetical protein
VRPEFEETFEGDQLDLSRWLPYYLPHWSSRERSAARYDLGGGLLRLRIDEDTEPWCPELDGEVRVSSLQTALFAGPLGSEVGQHPFNPAARVREEQENTRLYTPHYGRIEMCARATDDPDAMVSLWMVGLGDEAERSGEICVCEIFGRDVHEDHAVVGVGVHPFADPKLRDDFRRVTLTLDARDLHTYTADWRPDGVTFLVDGAPVAAVDQSPSYPLTLMLGIYAFPSAGEVGRHPKVFVVDHVRGFALAEAR